MTSGLQMKFGPVTSAPIPFGGVSDAVVIVKVRDFALAQGIVDEADTGQAMADKVAAWAAAQFVATVRAWVRAEARTDLEQTSNQAAQDYFDVE